MLWRSVILLPPCALFFSTDNDNYSFCWTAFKDLSPFCINGFLKLLNPKSLICWFCVAIVSFQFSILLCEIPLSCDVSFFLMFCHKRIYSHSLAVTLCLWQLYIGTVLHFWSNTWSALNVLGSVFVHLDDVDVTLPLLWTSPPINILTC